MYLQFDNLEFDETEIADEIFRAIEKEYGRGIARIPFFERTDSNIFELKVIFTDFKLLEARIIVIPYYGMASVKVEGFYY